MFFLTSSSSGYVLSAIEDCDNVDIRKRSEISYLHLQRESCITVIFVDWHTYVAQCLRISVFVFQAVATILEKDKSLFSNFGVSTDKLSQFFCNILKLPVVDVSVVRQDFYSKVFCNFCSGIFVISHK